MKFKLTSTTKNPKDNEPVYTYTGDTGLTVKFQAHPTQAWSWLFYSSSTAPKRVQNKVVAAYCECEGADVQELTI